MFTSQAAFRSDDCDSSHSSSLLPHQRDRQNQQSISGHYKAPPTNPEEFHPWPALSPWASGVLGFRKGPCRETEFQMSKDVKKYNAVKPDGTLKELKEKVP